MSCELKSAEIKNLKSGQIFGAITRSMKKLPMEMIMEVCVVANIKHDEAAMPQS